MPNQDAADADVISRARGCLLGQLAGDALGSLVEFRGPAEIRRRYPQGVRSLEDGGTWDTMAGQPTDDSEMALALARTLVAEGRFDLERVAQAYVGWYESGPFDIGNTCRTALSAAAAAMRSAGPAAQGARSGASRSSQANGALMRISPLGILATATDEEVAAWAREDAALTHPHPVCLAANAVFAATLAHAIRAESDPGGLHALASRVAQSQPDAGPVLDALQRAAESAPADFAYQAGWVCLALQNAFFQLLHAPSFEEGLVDTVGRGGDTDTNAAIAGALLGAAYGVAAIPERWRTCLRECRPSADNPRTAHPRPEMYWPSDAEELGVALLQVGAPPADPDAAGTVPGAANHVLSEHAEGRPC